MADSTFDRLAKKLTTHANTSGKERVGQKFIRTKDAQGRSVHLYETGKSVVVSPGASKSLNARTSGPTVYSGGQRMNSVADNPRKDSWYSQGTDSAGNRYHRYNDKAPGGKRVVRIKPKVTAAPVRSGTAV